jgi:ribonuclease BN (tRNA processing enzyme)
MENVSVTFLGTGDAFGSGGRFQTCMMIECPDTRFLIDCGASSLIAMKKYGVSPATIDTILVSHLHGDHFAGIPFFILDAQFSRRAAPLTIAGPPGIEARVRATMEALFPKSSEMIQRYPIHYRELMPSVITRIASVGIIAETVEHPSGAPSYALRVECAGRIIAYSGDTQWTDALLQIADGADLFICECFYYDKTVRYHIDYQSLINQKRNMGYKRLILTHLGEDMLDELSNIQLECAEDGKTIEL